MRIRTVILAGLAGAAAAYLFDPVSGRGRRTRLRDRTGAILRRGGTRVDKLSRHATNVMEGATHDLEGHPADRAMDDVTVADRIRSEVLGQRELSTAGLVVNVEDGVAFLRGELDDPALVETVVDRTKSIAGVRSIENLIHLPDSPAPNKASARSTGGRTNS
jgi:osmotically-inducible protein OsmY